MQSLVRKLTVSFLPLRWKVTICSECLVASICLIAWSAKRHREGSRIWAQFSTLPTQSTTNHRRHTESSSTGSLSLDSKSVYLSVVPLPRCCCCCCCRRHEGDFCYFDPYYSTVKGHHHNGGVHIKRNKKSLSFEDHCIKPSTMASAAGGASNTAGGTAAANQFYQLYRRSSIGMALTDALDELIESGHIAPHLARKVVEEVIQCFKLL